MSDSRSKNSDDNLGSGIAIGYSMGATEGYKTGVRDGTEYERKNTFEQLKQYRPYVVEHNKAMRTLDKKNEPLVRSELTTLTTQFAKCDKHWFANICKGTRAKASKRKIRQQLTLFPSPPTHSESHLVMRDLARRDAKYRFPKPS